MEACLDITTASGPEGTSDSISEDAAYCSKFRSDSISEDAAYCSDFKGDSVPEDAAYCRSERCEAVRVVLVGKTGVGKSASGNTILGREEFDSEVTPSSVTSQCKKERTLVDGREVYVVDTPGLFDTNYSEDEIKKEIAKCICLSSPGPHAFLVTIQLGRFTEEEQKTVKLIQKIFGKESANYTMVLFSHGDRLKGKSIETFISQSKELAKFTAKCRGGYHVFNNENQEDRSQVKELLQKIEDMVAVNGGGHYTNEMFQKAEAEIQMEKERISRQTGEEERDEEMEGLRRQLEERETLTKALEDELQKKIGKKKKKKKNEEETKKKKKKCTIL